MQECRWSMLLKFSAPISYSRILPELGKRTSDLLILETKDKNAIQVIQKACKKAQAVRSAPPVELSHAEKVVIEAEYWEGRTEAKDAYDALREVIQERKNALRKANKKLQRIQVNVLSSEVLGGTKEACYTQLDFDDAQGEVDTLYEALREKQGVMEGILALKKQTMARELVSNELLAKRKGVDMICESGQTSRVSMRGLMRGKSCVSSVSTPFPELYVGFIPQSAPQGVLSPVA